MKANAHEKAIDETVVNDIVQTIDRLLELINPHVTPLTAHERMALPKMGEKTLAFVSKSLEFAQNNPSLVPNYLDMQEFAVDFQDASGLVLAVNKAKQLLDNLADTQMAAGSEAFQCSLMFYHSSKAGAVNNIPGAKAVYEELRKRYPGRRRRHKAGGEDNTAANTESEAEL